MTHQELESAGDFLESAASSVADDDTRDRLEGLATQLSDLATGTPRPDHGRLARIQASLDEIQAGVSDDVAATIESALDEIRDYRETLDGV